MSSRQSLFRVARVIGASLALLLVAVSCGTDEEEGITAPATTAAPAAAPATTAAPAAAPATTAEASDCVPLRVSDQSDTDILELHLFRSTGAYTTTGALSWPPLDQTYEVKNGIMEGTWETVPSALIESVEWSNNGATATFTVKDGAGFADGKPITAHDFVYTFKRAIDSAGSYIPLLLPFVDIDTSDLIEVVDDRTFSVSANRPTALLERFLTFQVFAPIDKELAEANSTEEDPWAFDYFVDHNNSSGPYTIADWDRATGEIVLDLNQYYPGEVNNCGVIIKNIPDAEQRTQLLQSGELDVIMGVPPRLLPVLEEDPNITVYRAPSSRVNYLYMNRAFAPLDNKLVRQAISWAVPYDALLENVQYGYAQPAGTLVTSPMETYQGEAAGMYSLDLDKAREVFEQSGVEPFSIELGVQQSQAQDQQAAVLIQDNLRQIGIDVQINILPDGDFQSRRNNREMPMSFHQWYSWGDDPFYQMTFLAGCGQFVNFADGCNERLDEIVAEGKFETDPARRAELSLEAQKIMVDEASRVYLWSADWVIATQSDITGVKKTFSSVPRLEALGRGDFTVATAVEPVVSDAVAAPAVECVGEPLRVSDQSDTDILELHLFRSTGAYTTTGALSWPPLDQTYEVKNGIMEGTWETVPSALIESVEWSNNGATATFTVKDGAGFADGKPITAHDFVYTFKRAIDSAGSYIPLLLPFVDIDTSDLIEVVDDRTFSVSANRPTALLERFLTFQVFAPIDKELAEANSTEEDPWAFDYFVDHNNSSGPYTIADWDRATGEIVLDLNQYYPGEVNNCGVIIKNIPDAEQRTQLLQSGELDVIMGVPPRLLPVLEEDPNITVYRAPSSRVNYLYMNRAFAPLDNKLVRQAISWAVPYDALLENVQYGYAQPAGTLVTSPMETYQGEAAGMYSLDLDKAREVFEQSGVEPFSIELGVQQSQAQDQQAAVLIQDNLRQIGIDVQINILPDGDFQSRRNNREMPMSFHQWYSWGDDPFYQMTFLAGCGQFVNFADGCNERLDEIVAEGKFETDPARRAELSLEAQKIMVDEASRVYLWSADWIIATRSDITGVKKDFSSVPRLEALGRTG